MSTSLKDLATVPVRTPSRRSRDGESHASGTQTEHAYALLKRLIVRGLFPEGTFLSESEMRRKYGIGRTPFREACNRLHHLGLLQVVPRRGYFVPQVSFKDVRDLFETRVILEAVIAELAAVRVTSDQMGDLVRLWQHAESRDASGNSTEEIITANKEFHLCLARMARNGELLAIVTAVLEKNERLCYLEFRHRRAGWKDMELNHKPIVEAIERRDPAAAREAVTADIIQAELAIFGRDIWRRAPDSPFVDFPTPPI